VVVLPVIGGVLWMVNYRIPFVCGAVMSLVSPVAVQQMKITGKPFAFDPTN